jgi:hypothetical protein
MKSGNQAKSSISIFGFMLYGLLYGAAPAWSAPCSAPSNGQTALEAAGNGIVEGAWCELSTYGLTWSLIQPSGGGNCPNENHLEFGSTGVYDPKTKTAGVLSGPHSGTVGGACYPENIVFLLYDEIRNEWSLENQDITGLPNAGHGYDLTSVDPASGDMYVSTYNSNSLWRRSAAGEWQLIGDNPIIGCNGITCASGTTWDSKRNGYVRFGDSSERGVTLWSKSTGTWSQIAPDSAFGGFNKGYHFWAGYHRSTGQLWLHDGNGSFKHWRLNTDGTVSPLSQPPITLGCCGSNGRLSAYDFRTDRFVVVDPYTNTFFDFDIVSDEWVNLGAKIPMNWNESDIEIFVISIDAYGGLLMYVVAPGTGSDPIAYVYKHTGDPTPLKTPRSPDDLAAE